MLELMFELELCSSEADQSQIGRMCCGIMKLMLKVATTAAAAGSECATECYLSTLMIQQYGQLWLEEKKKATATDELEMTARQYLQAC